MAGEMDKIKFFALGFLVALAIFVTLLAINVFLPTPLLGGLLTLYSTSLQAANSSVREGDVIQVFGSTRCAPTAVILVDGQKVAEAVVANGDYAVFVPTQEIAVGVHTLSLEAGPCSRSMQVRIMGAACSPEGSLSPCSMPDGCDGTRVCIGGALSSCSASGKACQPGEKRGCTLPNRCGSGTHECDRCGTSWGECIA